MRSFFVFFLILLAMPAMSSAWTSSGIVTKLTSHNGIHIAQTTIIDNQCGAAGKFWWPTSDDDAKDMFSLALTSLLSGLNISVVYDENNAECFYGGSKITHMAIEK